MEKQDKKKICIIHSEAETLKNSLPKAVSTPPPPKSKSGIITEKKRKVS